MNNKMIQAAGFAGSFFVSKKPFRLSFFVMINIFKKTKIS